MQVRLSMSSLRHRQRGKGTNRPPLWGETTSVRTGLMGKIGAALGIKSPGATEPVLGDKGNDGEDGSHRCDGYGPLCMCTSAPAPHTCKGKGCKRKLHHMDVTECRYLTPKQQESDDLYCFKCLTGEEPTENPDLPLDPPNYPQEQQETPKNKRGRKR